MKRKSVAVFNVDDSSLAEAVDFLRLKARLVTAPDPDLPVPEFYIWRPRDLDGSLSVGGRRPELGSQRVSLRGENMSFREIIDNLAQQAGCRTTIRESFVIFYRPEETSDPWPPGFGPKRP